MEAWLRETFLPRLAGHALVILAGRVAPDAEWTLDPGWAHLCTALAVRPLDADRRSPVLLAARGVPAEQRGADAAFAGGRPLASRWPPPCPRRHPAHRGNRPVTS
ncbi:hypothetical protein [Streptomyces lasalocidi]|uniref:Uncharacterized protein n=1 Tax=Streptomyces lasalocidi TaxID=324833 RepID=B5M9N4_STRLS|nr:hypothetical protein [Streptomyces lasalocidi]CAQ64712.1 hypothetical protein [Streptomyces lasalocidi]